MGDEPTGWMLGSAVAGDAAPIPTVLTTSAMDAARAVVSLPMGAYPNRCAAAMSDGVESSA